MKTLRKVLLTISLVLIFGVISLGNFASNEVVAQENILSNSWTPPTLISAGSRFARHPRIVADGEGELHAVWIDEQLNAPSKLWYAHYNGVQWNTPVLLSNDAQIGEIAVDRNNHIHVVSGTEYFYSDGISWSPPIMLPDLMKPGIVSIDIAIDIQDNPHIVSSTSGGLYIQYTKYANSTWSDVQTLNVFDRPIPGIVTYPQIAIDGVSVHVLWFEHMPSGYYNVHTWFDGNSWSVPEVVVADAACLPIPWIAANQSGDMYFVTCVGDNQLVYYSWVNSSWSAPSIVPDSSSTSDYAIAVDEFGTVYLARSSELVGHLGYGGIQLYDSLTGNKPGPVNTDAKTPAITVDPDGTLYIIWEQGSDTEFGQIYFSYLIPPPDFSISVHPNTLLALPGSISTLNLSTTPYFGFDSQITFSVQNIPPSSTAIFTPTIVTPPETAVLSIATSPSTPLGTYTVDVIAESGEITHIVSFNILIVDAIYGVYLPLVIR